ncbi:MAG: geranylgeranyl reductase family protein [Deltaproteobacteria bacterium]|nr:geranylgeranyl reductase family protein [Deltaproteobacteria bacterium]
MANNNFYDVIVVGAGPGGSSTSTFLAREGVNVLLLDKSRFPRDKVCGDFLAPKAVYWIDMLGCINEVLDECKGYTDSGDLYVNGEYVISSGFPEGEKFPGFGVQLERRTLDHILVKNAVSSGVTFKEGCHVKKIAAKKDRICIEAIEDNAPVTYEAKMVIGSDGVNSVVSREIGNSIKGESVAASIRAYYPDMIIDKSKVQIYFDKDFFPGYGWVFADDSGRANVGVGYVYDANFPMKPHLKEVFDDFVAKNLSHRLKKDAKPEKLGGGRACFPKLEKTVAERVLLIGDAANMTDPINGGGIHIALEGGHLAAFIAMNALERNDFSAENLNSFNEIQDDISGLDRLTGSLILSIARNPNLREAYLLALKMICEMTRNSKEFRDMCGGIFTGVTPASACFSPLTIVNAIPVNPAFWIKLLNQSQNNGSGGVLKSGLRTLIDLTRIISRMMENPTKNLNWGMDVISKASDLGIHSMKKGISARHLFIQ